LPSAGGKPFTFGCFNNLAKLNAEVIGMWSEILRAIPGSRLILRARYLDDADTRQILTARWQAAGAPLERIEMFGPVPHAHLLAAYGDIDLALDPFPFGGGMTTLEALWMGVPVLTLLGERPAGRQSASFLRQLDLPQFIASDTAEYLRRAREIQADRRALLAVRASLRERIRASPLCDARGFVQNLEELLLNLLQK
jgi:predicted O-linked N-acetylglucosamine transferase (SPINDLY family)